MGVDASAMRPSSGLTTVVDTIAAPKTAFERLREAPTWGWALIIVLALMAIGYFLQMPASQHAGVTMIQHVVANNPQMSDAQKAKMIAGAQHPNIIGGIFGIAFSVFLIVLINTLVTLIGNALGKGQADFKRLWCASMNIAVPTVGIVSILLGVITMMRGAESFSSPLDLQMALPGLQMLVPGVTGATRVFLGAFNVGTLWGLFLNATMLMTLARVGKGVAWGTAAAVLLVGAAFALLVFTIFTNLLHLG